MRLAIQSASAAVRRTLEWAVSQSGHHLVAQAVDADLILIDSIHPTENAKHTLPVLTLSTHGSVGENILNCPLRPQSLVQRLMMLANTQAVALGQGWQLDMQARALTHPSAPALPLTEKECALLKHLAHAYPAALNREELLEQVWGMASDVDTHTLETHIYRLRAKLEPLTPSACDILTENGAYVLALGNETR